MKLAEALALRADAQKRLAQVTTRAVTNARYQEGEPPIEDAAQLHDQARAPWSPRSRSWSAGSTGPTRSPSSSPA